MLKTVKMKLRAGLRGVMRGRAARRFLRQQDGAAAVEFALVALPFLALLFAILETAMVFFAGQTLEAATAESARLLLTGQAQTAGFSKDDFKTQVCNRVYGLFDCAGGVYVDVKNYSNSFASVTSTPPVNNGVLNTNAMSYAPGGPGCITVVSLYYQWPVYISLFTNLSNLNGSNRLLQATAVFRNEPYGGPNGC